MIDELERLVAFQPVTDDTAAVESLIDYVEGRFQKAGLITRRLVYDGVPNLYASTRNSKHSRLLLQAHIDVVPGDQPFRKEGDKIYGRGVYDMLFGTASFLRLVDEMGDELLSKDIAFMLSGDEEHGGMSGVKRMLEDGYTTDVCVLPDAGNGFGSMSIGAKGVYHVKIRINGKAHHGSRPWEGEGATGKLVMFLNELTKQFDTSDQANSTVTISLLEAGEALNQGPATATVGLDIRYKDRVDLKRIETVLKRLMKQYDGEVIFLHTGSDFQLDTTHRDVVRFIEGYERTTGKPIEFVRAHGSSDARFFSERGMPVIMFRPDGGGAHGDEEWLSASSYEQFYAVLKDFVSATH